MTKSRIALSATFVLILLLCGQVVADSAEELFNKAVAAERSGNLDTSIELFGQAAKLAPDNAAIYNNRGIIRARKKDLDLAIEDFDQAIRLDPDNAGGVQQQRNGFRRKEGPSSGG